MAIGFYAIDDLLDASATEREHMCHLLLTSRGCWAREFRRILEARAGSSDQPKKPRSHSGVAAFANLNSRVRQQGIGELQRPRREAANLFPTTFHERRSAEPP